MPHLTSHIQRLPSEVVNRIAAGEVIQKPFNAVKELLENAVDSGATNISVYLEDGGYTKIIIRDNGCGIFPEDANKIATRFHSSKIRTVDEVYNIKTFGFRGEALSSMALIGKLVILSKRREYELGIRIVVDAKNREVTQEPGLENGTSITVTDIFSDFSSLEVKKSVQHITKLFRDYALVLKNVKLVLNAPELVFRSPSANPDEVVELKLWMERITGEDLIEVDFELTSLKCQGKCYYSAIKEQKPGVRNVSDYVILVNKRLVTIPELVNRMNRLLSEYFSRVEHFIFVFEMDPSFIDVHISPTKHLVTLKDGGELIEMIVQTLSERFESLRQDKVISTMETAGISPKSEVKLNITFSQIPLEEKELSQSFSTPKMSVPIPCEKIRIDHNQSFMDSFIQSQKPEVSNNEDSFIQSSPEIEILSDKVTVVQKKRVVDVPVVVGPSRSGHYKVVGYHQIIGKFESNFSFMFGDQILVHVLPKNYSELLSEKPEYVEMVVDARKLQFPIYVAQRNATDYSLMNLAKKAQKVMLDSIEKESSNWAEKLRKAVNLKISKVNRDFALFGQYQTEFFVVPFPDILQEYIQQILIRKLCDLQMSVPKKPFSFKAFVRNHCSEKLTEQIPQNWSNLKSTQKLLYNLFSLNFEFAEDDVVVTGVPVVLSTIPVPFEAFTAILPIIPSISLETTKFVLFRYWIYVVTKQMAASITNFISRDLDLITAFKNSDFLELRSNYFPGKLFLKNLVNGSTNTLYKCFERC